MLNTFNNLINGINDSTFQNVEIPIGQEVGQAVGETIQAKEKLLNQSNGIGNIEETVGQEVGQAVGKTVQASEDAKEKTLEDALKWAEEQQAKEWAREDEIRKETQAREDSALQRWVADAQRAGINPNLFSGQGAASGGGITSATGLNMSQYETQANRLLEEWQTMIEQDFERNENRKDRYTKVLSGLLNLAGLGIFAGKAGKAGKANKKK